MKTLLPVAIALVGLFSAMADDVRILWDPPVVTNGVTGYQVTVTIGSNAQIPVFSANLSGLNSTQQVVTSLIPGTNYIGTVRSMNGPYLLSVPVSTLFTVPSGPSNIRINSTMQQSATPYGPWEDVTNQVVEVVASSPKKFYRSKLDALNYAR